MNPNNLTKRYRRMTKPGFWILLALLVVHCKQEMKVTIMSPEFTINGKTTPSGTATNGANALSGSIETEVKITNRFASTVAEPDIPHRWYVDGIEQSQASNVFEHAFIYPGTYEVRHCLGDDTCAHVFLLVREIGIPVPDSISGPEATQSISQAKPEPIPRKNPESPAPVSPKDYQNSTSMSDASSSSSTNLPHPGGELSKPVEEPVHEAKLTGKTAKAGLSVSAFDASCSKWVESGQILIRPKALCQLNSATLVANGSGKASVRILEGGTPLESMNIILTEGKTQFTFSEWDLRLQPGKTYTLQFSTLSSGGTKPKIANISGCSASPKGGSGIVLDYGTQLILFDLTYSL